MIGKKVLAGASIIGGFQLIARFFDMIALVIVARLLTPEDFGLFSIAASTLLIANSLTELPVIDVLVQRRDFRHEDVDTAFTLTTLRGLLIAVLLIAGSHPLAAFYEDDRLITVIWVLALGPVFQGLASPMMVKFLRDMNFGPTAKAVLFGKLISTSASVVVAWLTGSYWALVAGLVTAPVITAIATHFIAPYRPRIRFGGMFSILNFAGWVTISRIIFTLNQQSDRFFIGAIVGKASLGRYALGSDLSSLVTYTLAGPVMQPLFAGLSQFSNDRERMANAYLRSQRVMMSLVLPLAVGFACVASPAITLFFGAKWTQATGVAEWLAPVIGLQMMTVPIQAASMAMARPRPLALRELCGFAIRLPATLAGAFWGGILWAAAARSLTGFVIIYVNLVIARELMGLSVTRQLANCMASLMSAATMGAAIIFIRWQTDTPGEPIALGLYTAALILCGAATYVSVHAAIWFARGRPDGLETLVANIASRRLTRLRGV